MTIQNLIIKHKQFALNDSWKYQHLTFKIHNGSIKLSLYTKNYNDTCKLQYSDDNGRNWYDVKKVEKKSVVNDNECEAKYTIGEFDNSVKLRGNVLYKISNLDNQWGVFSVKCNDGATYDVCGNPASLYSIDSFASIKKVDLSNLFANKEISDNALYYDDNKLSWKTSGTNKIFVKKSSNIKYDGNSVYGDNGLLSIKNLWLQHPYGTYTNMFIGSNVKTITDYMPISGKCEGMFYNSQITSDNLKLQLPSIQNIHIYEGMFAYCPNIKNITVNIEKNLEDDIQDMDKYAGMFLGCENLEKINVTYSNITSSLSKTIKSMFFECNNINQFNITFDNISVPKFDEYFRFTIPSTLTDCSESELSIINTGIVRDGRGNRQIDLEPISGLFKNTKIKKTPYIKLTDSSIHCLFKDADDLEEINIIETDGNQSNLFYDSTNRPNYENLQIINYSKYIEGSYSGNTIDYNYVKLKERKTPLTIYTNAGLVGKISGGDVQNYFYNTINILQNQPYDDTINTLPNDSYSIADNTLFSLPYIWGTKNLKVSVYINSGTYNLVYFHKQGWVKGLVYHTNFQKTGDGFFQISTLQTGRDASIGILTNEDEYSDFINPTLTGYYNNYTNKYENNTHTENGEFGYAPIGIFIKPGNQGSLNYIQPISKITVEIKKNDEYELVSSYIPIRFTSTELSNKFGFIDEINNITYII